MCVCTQAEFSGLVWLFGTGNGVERNEGLSALASDHLVSDQKWFAVILPFTLRYRTCEILGLLYFIFIFCLNVSCVHSFISSLYLIIISLFKYLLLVLSDCVHTFGIGTVLSC